ncbi:MAG TPA: hypothetical protein PLD84_15620 [Chitinophagales bacterium]|nr:hypothetical protein [Chitinophagales bacterium]
MNRNLFKSLVFTAVLALVTVTTVYAQTVVAVEKFTAEKANAPEIRFVGSNHDFINFEVSVRQAGNQKQILRIIDENGVELYRENLGKGEFTKLVKIVRNDYARLNFVVDAPNAQFKKSFNIKNVVVERLSVEEAN